MPNLTDQAGDVVSEDKLIYGWISGLTGKLTVYRSRIVVEHGEMYQPIRDIVETGKWERIRIEIVKDVSMAYGQAILEEFACG